MEKFKQVALKNMTSKTDKKYEICIFSQIGTSRFVFKENSRRLVNLGVLHKSKPSSKTLMEKFKILFFQKGQFDEPDRSMPEALSSIL